MDRVTAIVWAWSPSGRYSLLSSIAGPAPGRWIDALLKSTSRGECRSADSVSGRKPSPTANSSEDTDVLLACRLRLSARN